MALLHRCKRGDRADDACGKPQFDNRQDERERKQQQPRELVHARVLGYEAPMHDPPGNHVDELDGGDQGNPAA